MTDDTIIDLKEAVRNRKQQLDDRWYTEHTHFMDLMNAIIPAMNLVGKPMLNVGWSHVVQRAMDWRKMLASQQIFLETAVKALQQGIPIEDVAALLTIQAGQVERALALWEPVSTNYGEEQP